MSTTAQTLDASPPPTAAQSAASARANFRVDLAIYVVLTLLVLSAKWISAQGWYTPWSRVGYWIGVAGGVSMLLLFSYPLRKRWKVTYNWGAAKHWFVIHMILGILGPWLILLHSTFQIGSTNAAVALYSMIIVALSGVIGRFLYVRLHADLRGEKASLNSLRGTMGEQHEAASTQFGGMPRILSAMHTFEEETLDPNRKGVMRDMWRLFVLPIERQRVVRACKQEVKKAVKAVAVQQKWSSSLALNRYRAYCEQVDNYAASVQKVAQFQTFDRLFSLWHVAHVPFVWIMVFCAIFHIVAVHAY